MAKVTLEEGSRRVEADGELFPEGLVGDDRPRAWLRVGSWSLPIAEVVSESECELVEPAPGSLVDVEAVLEQDG